MITNKTGMHCNAVDVLKNFTFFTKSVVIKLRLNARLLLLLLPSAQVPVFVASFSFISSLILPTFLSLSQKWLKTLIQSTGPIILRQIRKMGTGLHQQLNINRLANGKQKKLSEKTCKLTE